VQSKANRSERSLQNIRVALFCGGRGSGTIIRALLRRSEVDLTLLVNAYDDGLSTGALRSFIPGMLGPSDFRKNYSTLISTYSNAQYALRSIVEHRLPSTDPDLYAARLESFCAKDDLTALPEQIRIWVDELDRTTRERIRKRLGLFFEFVKQSGAPFNFDDCSLGNLIFAGSYLQCDRDFNRASEDFGQVVGARASLVNVSCGENRILVALKEDGAFLGSEAQVVGPQSAVPIRRIFFLERPLDAGQRAQLDALDVQGRIDFLSGIEAVPDLSPEAGRAIADADIILFGPGTQHSSLLPSYRIAGEALRGAGAPVRALVMNLDEDHDIAGLTASDIVDRVLDYGSEGAACDGLVTHVLLNRDAEPGRLAVGKLVDDEVYRGARVIRGAFSTPYRPRVHNGSALADAAVSTWKTSVLGSAGRRIDFYLDMNRRSGGVSEAIDDFLEMNWEVLADQVTMKIKSDSAGAIDIPKGAQISFIDRRSKLTDVDTFYDWLDYGNSEYLAMMSGDGSYKFSDVFSGLAILSRKYSLAASFGSRTQSRKQFVSSIKSAYSENIALYFVAKCASIALSLILYARVGVVFSDPLTGLRVFRRSQIVGVPGLAGARRPRTLLGVSRALLKSGAEVAEFPAEYRTFAGFTEPGWRMQRGLRGLMDLVFG
jgi:2-phospho-L-lactate transferase/gluconeogenesis factor (CofD/UPF0052 family)